MFPFGLMIFFNNNNELLARQVNISFSCCSSIWPMIRMHTCCRLWCRLQGLFHNILEWHKDSSSFRLSSSMTELRILKVLQMYLFFRLRRCWTYPHLTQMIRIDLLTLTSDARLLYFFLRFQGSDELDFEWLDLLLLGIPLFPSKQIDDLHLLTSEDL